jgi:hypothetical protein
VIKSEIGQHRLAIPAVEIRGRSEDIEQQSVDTDALLPVAHVRFTHTYEGYGLRAKG